RARTSVFLHAGPRSANEDLSAARRVARAGWIERPVDHQVRHAGARRVLREQIVHPTRVRLAHDGDANRLWSSGDLQPQRTAGIAVEHPDALAVERDFDRVVGSDRRQTEETTSRAT